MTIAAQNLVEGGLQKVEYLETEPQTFKIPSNTDAKCLFLRAEGADGGRRYNAELNVNYAGGGEGATIKAWFPIGIGKNQIPPGADIRMIIGYKGSSMSEFEMYGAGGGGGTGILFRKPGTSKWHLLMVAGGGGGGAYGIAVYDQAGDPGNDATFGTKNGGTDGTGGVCGGGGNCDVGYIKEPGSGGGGIYGSGEGHFGGGFGWSQNPEDPYLDPVGGAGGRQDKIGDTHVSAGGWGFGGGGSGVASGGGGGGYSGGGGGSHDSEYDRGHGGGGGGSYVNTDYAASGAIITTKNGSTASPGSGFVEYQLLYRLPAIKLASASQKCVDVESDIMQNGHNVRLWDCSPFSVNQSWQFEGSKVNLVNNSTKCLDVENHQTTNGTNVRIWDCMEHDEQRWIYDGVSRQIRSYLNLEKCLNDAYGGRTDNGTNIMLWACYPGGGAGDQWLVDGAVTVSNPNEVKSIVPIKNTGLALQSSQGANWGSNIQLGAKDTDDNTERWVFDGMQIKYGPSRDLCVTLKDANTTNGTNIELRGCSNVPAKKWIYDGMTQQIRSVVDPDKCMEVADGVFEAGTNIQIRNCNRHSRQKFDIK